MLFTPTMRLCSRYFFTLVVIPPPATPSNSKRKPIKNGFHTKIRPSPNLPLFQAVLACIRRFSAFCNLLPLFLHAFLPCLRQFRLLLHNSLYPQSSSYHVSPLTAVSNGFVASEIISRKDGTPPPFPRSAYFLVSSPCFSVFFSFYAFFLACNLFIFSYFYLKFFTNISFFFPSAFYN